ncbi:hypothetical protein [Luteococcus sp.]|uniref:hypothetical protein n=1 Tax=Luteococcus sp. TaxID=1969402 RepID=UPI003734C461
MVSTEAPTIQAGDWTDTVGPKGGKDATKYYRLKRTIPGSTMAVSAIYQPETNVEDMVDVDLTSANGRVCASGTGYHQSGAFSSATAVTGLRDEGCAGGEMVVEVSHDELYAAKQPRKVQLKVTEVPPVTNISSLPEAPRDGLAKAPAIGTPTPMTGGKSLSSAAAVEAGKTYSGTIAGNDVQTFKVPVGNGQRLATTLKFPKISDQLAAPFNDLPLDQSWRSTITVLSPDGRRVGRDVTLYLGSIDATAEVGTGTVATRNLANNVPDNWLAGYYTVVVSLEGPAGKKTPAVPFAFATDVTGSITPAPEYAAEGLAPSSSASPSDVETTSPAPSSEGSASASAESSATQETSSETASAEQGSSALPVVLGAGGLALVAGGIALALRNRRR